MANALAPVELLRRVFDVEMEETRFNETPILGLLANTAVLQDRRDISWTANLGEPTIGGRALAAALSNDTQTAPTSAQLAIPDYLFKHQFTVLKRDVREAAAVGEIGAIRDILGYYVVEATRLLALRANSAIITGNGTLDATNGGVFGLEYVLNNANNYAGINRSTYTRWQSIVQQGATPGTPEALTVRRITDMKLARRAAGATYQGGTGLVILTDPRIMEITMRALYRQDANPQGGYNGILNISDYTQFFAEGIPVLSDYDVQDNTMMFLDLNKHQIVQFDLRDPLDDPRYIRYGNYRGLQFRIAQVDGNLHPDKATFEITMNLQMKVRDPLEGVSAIRDVSLTAA